MINFKVYVKNENGIYEDIQGEANAVFPLNTSELLDEQLDELRLIIKNSIVDIYQPLTEVKIEILTKETVEENGSLVTYEEIVKTLYMVVGQDKPIEFPIGKSVLT